MAFPAIGGVPRGRGASTDSNLIDAMNHESPSHDPVSLTHVTRRGATWPIVHRATSTHLLGMRACADAHGLLRACLEQASGNGIDY
jgi:hypothetical protein